MTRNGWVVLLAGLTMVACSQEEDDRDVASPVAVAARTDSAAHAEHGFSDPATDHSVHLAGRVDGPVAAHDGHMTAGAAVPSHAGHAASTAAHAGHGASPASGDHRAHDVASAGAAHAQHADTTHADTSHALHADTSHAQHADTAHALHADTSSHAMHVDTPMASHDGMRHEMTMVSLGDGGWMAIGMAQAFAAGTMSLPNEEGTPLEATGLYLTQPALMVNLESPQSRVSLRTTLNFEGLTQPDGELTFGAWGEGFIDKRHPHTLLHEAMLSLNIWSEDESGVSLSVGKGFAPYGTDDPMSRPVLKYPTNHHLSQILERWTLNGVYSTPRWSVEVGVFGGSEPTDPWDLSNVESFANSFSTRVARRFGAGAMGIWEWELSGSYGYVVEEHDGEELATQLYNVAFRHEHEHGFGRMYYLTEASLSDPEHHDGYWSVLGEASLMIGGHNPYGRIEYATRPEYPRDGAPGSDDFFRYDHDAEPLGSTRWLSLVGGYGFSVSALPLSARPYVEAQWNRVGEEDGGIDPEALFGRSSFFGLSAGVRMFFGGEPMRMGSYGVLDSITLMHRMQMGEAPAAGHQH